MSATPAAAAPASAAASTAVIEYTREEIAQHKSADDCWIIYHGDVLRVPKNFADMHPTGDVFMDSAGVDGSAQFDNEGHPPSAVQMMKSWKIGVLKVSTTTSAAA